MDKISVPVHNDGKGGLKVSIDLRLYSEQAIMSAVYRYTDKFYVYQQIDETNDKLVNVFFEVKDKSLNEIDVKCFCNDLIDEQVRANVNQQFGHIRDLIVEEAFKPISK